MIEKEIPKNLSEEKEILEDEKKVLQETDEKENLSEEKEILEDEEKENLSEEKEIEKRGRGRPKGSVKKVQQVNAIRQAQFQVPPPKPPFKDLKIAMDKEQILTLMSEGATFLQATELVGISKPTVERWRREDDAFKEDLLKALQTFKMHHIKNIARHSDIDWKASKFLLERKFPHEFGEKVFQQIEQVGEREESFAAQLLKQLLPNSPPPPSTPVQTAPITTYTVNLDNPNREELLDEEGLIDEVESDPVDQEQVFVETSESDAFLDREDDDDEE